MYTTAIISDEISQDLTVAARLAKSYGLNSLEIRSVSEKNPFQMEGQDYIDIKRIVDEFGLTICDIGSPFFKCDIDSPAQINEHLEHLKRMMDVCHLWDTKMIRGFTFWRNGSNESAPFELIAEKFCPVIDILKDAGITMVIESEPACWVHDIRDQVKLIEMINNPLIAALYDPGNEIAAGAAQRPYPEGFHMLRKYIRHVHLKDMKKSPIGKEPALLGEGDVDFHGIIDSLKADGYDGCVSVETHFRIKARMDEDLLVRPQGSGFSEGGYESSEKYLQILHDQYHWMEG